MRVTEIPPRSGTAFRLGAGQVLRVIDPRGVQVADLLAYAADDVREVISAGRTFDYEETIRLTAGNKLWSNRSRVMLEIVEDTAGVHDFLLTHAAKRRFATSTPNCPSTAAASATSPPRWPPTGSSPTLFRRRSTCS